MLIKALKGKIHRATVTQTKIDYPGSIAIDADLMDAAGIRPYEEVLLANITNGSRVNTYVVKAPAASGDIVVLGAAARMFSKNDLVIILNFGYFSEEELKDYKPKVVLPDADNKISEIL